MPAATRRADAAVAKAVKGVPAAADRGVDVKEVAGGGPVVEGIHLAGHDVVGMQHRTDVHLYRRLGTPVSDQLHPMRPVWLYVARIGDVEPGECVQSQVDLDIEALGLVCRDHLIYRGREVRLALPVGEQVHILARALQNPVHRDCVPASESKPEGSADA